MNLNRRQLLAALAGLALLPSASFAQVRRGMPDRPNVLLIMADDAGREMFGYSGGTYTATPRIDALAARSMRLDQCYSTPICAPSRVELLTGLYPFENGWVNNPRPNDHCRIMSTEIPTLGRVFQNAGYRTALAGKWHLSHPDVQPDHITEAGFDEWLAWAWVRASDNEHFNIYWDPAVVTASEGITIREGALGPNLYAGFLMNFMARAAAANEPFFAYYPMVLPHSPFCEMPDEAPDFASLMDDDTHYEGTVPTCDPITERTTNLFPQLINYTDQIVGRLVEFLDTNGLFDNTVVVFTTDNGTHRDITAFYQGQEVSGGKGTFFDLGINAPFIMGGGGVPAGDVTAPIDFTGIHNALANLAVGDPNWQQVITQSAYAMTALDDGWAISDGRWKYVSLGPRAYAVNRKRNERRAHGSRTPFSRKCLYDLRADPFENHPWNPLSVMTNPEARAQWERLEAEGERRFAARGHIRPDVHYPRGHEDCLPGAG